MVRIKLPECSLAAVQDRLMGDRGRYSIGLFYWSFGSQARGGYARMRASQDPQPFFFAWIVRPTAPGPAHSFNLLIMEEAS